MCSKQVPALPTADRKRPVLVFERRIKYALRFAIPAMIFAALWVVLGVTFLLVVLFVGTRLAHIRQLLNQTATGNVVTNVVDPHSCPHDAPTKQWARAVGKMNIRLESETAAIEWVSEGFLSPKKEGGGYVM